MHVIVYLHLIKNATISPSFWNRSSIAVFKRNRIGRFLSIDALRKMFFAGEGAPTDRFAQRIAKILRRVETPNVSQ